MGGSEDDIVQGIHQTADGGYIIAGSSTSSGSGDVISINHGFGAGANTDWWLLRLDKDGKFL